VTAKPLLEARFAQFNERYFGGRLPRAPITFFNRWRDPVTGDEKFAGYTGDAKLRVSLVVITDEALARGSDFVADSLLHEMIHHAQVFLHGESANAHGAMFTSIANRIADEMGLEHVEAGSEGASCWPQTLR